MLNTTNLSPLPEFSESRFIPTITDKTFKSSPIITEEEREFIK